MYRCRPVVLFLKKRKVVLSAKRQVIQRIPWQYKSLSNRTFSDSVKVLTRQEVKEEKDGSILSGKSSKKKLFSIDEIVIDKTDTGSNDENISSSETVGHIKTSEEVLKEGTEKIDLTEPEASHESTAEEHTVESSTHSDELEVDVNDVNNAKQVESSPKSADTIGSSALFLINKINTHNIPAKILEILSTCLDKSFGLKEKNAVIICALKRLEKLNVHDLEEDMETKLQDHLEHRSNVSRTHIADLINILEYFIKKSEDKQITLTILHELCWRLRRSTVRGTLDILGVLKDRLSTDKRKEVHTMAEKRLVESIDNVSSPGELLSLMYSIGGKDEAWPRIEEEAQIMLMSMDTIHTYRLLFLLALNRSRNVKLINKAKKHLCSRPINFDAEKLRNLFFTCDVLRINDPNLLKEMSVNMLDILENESKDNGKNISLPVLKSCSKMNWNYRKLTDSILKDIDENIRSVDVAKKLSDLELASVVMSIGHFNLNQYGDLVHKVMGQLKSGNSLKPVLWLNVVHSLAFIQKCDKKIIQDILAPEFCSSLQQRMKVLPDSFKNNMSKKLLNLYGYLKEDLHETSEHIEKQASEWRGQLQEMLKSAPLVGLAKVVSEVLTDIAPLEKYTNRNVVTKYGYVVDFEIFVDKKLKAVRLDEAEGMQKVWIKMLNYNGYIQGDTQPQHAGGTAMMLRHLKSENNAVIVYVPYSDWSMHDRKMDHLLYLENKIKAAVYPETQELGQDMKAPTQGSSEDTKAPTQGSSEDTKGPTQGSSEDTVTSQ